MSQLGYTQLLEHVESYLQAHQPHGTPDTLYEPIRYINDLGGKRIRPVLLLMAYNLWHEDVVPALPAALAIEYFHNFSLMHDDIMDEAPLRRGKPSVYHHYGRNAAILSGDVMLIRCFDLLLQAGTKNGSSVRLTELMCQASLEICEGQQMDMDFENLASPREQAYVEMIRKKTACLIGTSLQMGALLAGAGEQDAKALYDFGEKIGLGFQIQDDYLDVFGDPKLTGKQKGGDILRGKKNFMFVHLHNILSPPDQAEFADAYRRSGEQQDVTEVMGWYEKQNIAGYTKKVQEDFFREGLGFLQVLPAEQQDALTIFAQKLIHRSF